MLSRFLTRSGDQAWDFAVPVTLVSLFPSQIFAVGLVYLVSKLGSVLLQPWLAGTIDRWKRLHTAILGTGLQLVGVLLVIVCFILLSVTLHPTMLLFQTGAVWPLLVGVTLGSVSSQLGSGLMDIAVGNDWIPVVIPPQNLALVNSRIKQLDLFTEVVSPVVAGLLIAVKLPHLALAGFLLVGCWNVFSFVPELLLLRSVFLSSPLLQQSVIFVPSSGSQGMLEKLRMGWNDFKAQPTALPMVAFAALWLSALSPHGFLLTGFLKGGWAMPEVPLGVFRGLGAVFGLMATVFFPLMRSRFGLLGGTRFFIILQALVLIFSLPFFYFRVFDGWIFLSLVLISRVGLYGFSLGETELRQRSIPEGQRGRVNGVAGSLTSLATLILYGVGTLFSAPENFHILVIISAGSVCAGALLFTHWSLTDAAKSV